jgi:hypothetical protein
MSTYAVDRSPGDLQALLVMTSVRSLGCPDCGVHGGLLFVPPGPGCMPTYAVDRSPGDLQALLVMTSVRSLGCPDCGVYGGDGLSDYGPLGEVDPIRATAPWGDPGPHMGEPVQTSPG